MHSLSIDIGNNKIKLDFWADEGFLYRYVKDEFSIDEIQEEVKKLDIKGIIVSSVRKDYRSIIKELKDKSGCALIIDFNNEEIKKYSDKIKYKGNIGADRIAAFLGAQTQVSGPKLIIDAGTAITLDIADNEGNYCGGNISLGFQTRLKALADATSLLPKVQDLNYSSFFGDETLSAIVAGAKNGVTGEILYTIELAKQQFQIEQLVIAGGDANVFLPSIEKNWGKCIYDKSLVGRGLNYHLRKFYFPDVFPYTNFHQTI